MAEIFIMAAIVAVWGATCVGAGYLLAEWDYIGFMVLVMLFVCLSSIGVEFAKGAGYVL